MRRRSHRCPALPRSPPPARPRCRHCPEFLPHHRRARCRRSHHHLDLPPHHRWEASLHRRRSPADSHQRGFRPCLPTRLRYPRCGARRRRLRSPPSHPRLPLHHWRLRLRHARRSTQPRYARSRFCRRRHWQAGHPGGAARDARTIPRGKNTTTTASAWTFLVLEEERTDSRTPSRGEGSRSRGIATRRTPRRRAGSLLASRCSR